MTLSRRILAGVTILGLVVAVWLLFAPKADATGYCQLGHKHCETTTTTMEETTTTEATTTTLIEETTTTLDATTTTASTGSSTTTEGSTTIPENGSFWSASSECQTLTAEWGEGIVQVNLYLMDGQVGEIQVDGFTTSGETKDATTFRGEEWVLVPVVETGYGAVPDQITLFTEVCTSDSSTTTPESSTLPFTGISRFTWTTMIFVAAASGILGFMLVMGARDEE